MNSIPWDIVGWLVAAIFVLVAARKFQSFQAGRKRLTCSVCREKVAADKDFRAMKHPKAPHSMMDCLGVGRTVLERRVEPRAVPKAA